MRLFGRYASGMAQGRIQAQLQRVRDIFPLTNLGVVVGLAAAAAHFGFALEHADYALQIVAVMTLALVALAMLVVLIGAVALHLQLKAMRDPDALRFEAQRGFARGLWITRQRWLMLLEVSWSWLDPDGPTVRIEREADRFREVVEAPGRLHTRGVTRRFVVEDGFGLARIVLQHDQNQAVDVLPWSGRLEEAALEATLATGDAISHPRGDASGDRVDMRRYSPGDPLRLVLWKVYARTGELMVRTRERAVSPDVRVAAYLPSTVADEPAAAAARVALQGRLLGPDWLFGADGHPAPLADIDASEAAIVASRAVRGTDAGDAMGLSKFVEAALGNEAGRLLVFVPGKPGPWLDRVVDVCRRRPGNVTAVVVVDGVQQAPPPRPTRWWFVRTPPADPAEEAVVTPDELNAVTASLSRAGAELMVLDRPSGKFLGSTVQADVQKVAA